MTDNEIIKALGQCETQKTCSDCPYFEKIGCKKHLYQDAYTLINRQKAEIERLQSELSIWKDIAHRETIYVSIAKAEAIKEFAERLKEKSFKTIRNYGLTKDVVEVCDIDNLVKEMVGGEETNRGT